LWVLPNIKVAKADEWPPKPVEASDYPTESAYTSQKPASHLDSQDLDGQSSNGHLNGRIDDADTKDAVSEVAGALQQLFDHNPERREYASEQLAMELYYSDYLDQEPSYETVTAAMKMLDSVSSRA
jgi:hypothetical protein